MGPSASQYPNTQPRDISCFADRRATPGSVVGELGGEYDRRASQRLVILPLLRALGIAFCGVAEQGGSSPQPTAQRRLDLFPRLAGQGFGVGRSQSLIDKRSFGRRHGEVVGVDRRPELIDQLNPLGDSELLRPGKENLIEHGHIKLTGTDNSLRREDARHGSTKPHPANGMGLVSCPAAGESSG